MDVPAREEDIPVVREGRIVAVLSRMTSLSTLRTPSRLELTYLAGADSLAAMVAEGAFPIAGSVTGSRRGAPRVGDGMLRLNGEYNGRRIFDMAVIDDLKKGGDREKFKASGMVFRPGYSYHNQWWILHNADGAFEASGVNGQMVHINPAAEMVVVKLASHPVAGAGFTHATTLKAWAALAQAVRQ